MAADDPRLTEAQAMALVEVAEGLALDLRRMSGEMVGPCPDCGGTDRFAISIRKNVFNCRKCGAKGDAIALVQLAMRCDFKAALAYLCGERDLAPDPAEIAARKARAEAAKKRRDAETNRYRQEAIAQARRIWTDAIPADRAPPGSGPLAFLERRGISLTRAPACLRYHPALPYMVAAEPRGSWREVHRGPAMVAAVQGQNGKFCAVHRTWFDLARPKGKALILNGEEQLKTKESRGRIKGGAIRLWTPETAEVLVVGEGIETTLTAFVAGDPDHAYWAGISLGNMAGRRQTGPGLKYAGRPDMGDAEAFVPPPWVRRLIFIQDGDSDPRLTRAQLEAGLRRAMLLRPGLTGSIVHAGEGRDLNDILLEAPDA